MLKVMIVDDNKSVLDGLKYLINWEECGYTVAAAVRTGKEAIKTISEIEIDLIITDIRMPNMTGFELVEKLREQKENLKFILISGYSEFDYAKWAIDNRIDGYILKPIDEDELILKLKNIKDEIEKERANRQIQSSLFLENMLSGNRNNANGFDVVDGFETVRCCIIRPCDNELFINDSDNYIHGKVDTLYNIISSIPETSQYFLKSDVGEVVFVIPGEDDLKNVKKKILYIDKEVSKLCDFNYIIFVGRKIDIEDVRESLFSIRKLEDVAFYKKHKNVFIEDEYEDEVFVDFLTSTATIDSLIYAIKNNSEEQVRECVKLFFKEAAQNHIRKASVIKYVNNIIFDVCNSMSENGIDTARFLFRGSKLEKGQNPRFDTIVDFLEENALEMNNIFKALYDKDVSGVIGKIIDYVDANYMNENLNLQYLSEQYHINVSHLGKLFKKKTGRSFNSYLMNIRIEKAKELLMKSNFKVYEIAYKVGFNSHNYFTTKFIEIEKVTPIKYREQLKQKSE